MDLFVGRKETLHKTLATLRKKNEGIVQDIIGVHGIGKTMFLDRLAAQAQEIDRIQIFSLDMAKHGLGEGFFNDFGPTATAQVLWATFDCSRRLMHEFANRAGTDDFDHFRIAYQQQSKVADSFFVKTDISLGRRSRLQENEIVSSLNVGDEFIKQRIREMQSILDDAFVRDWTDYARHRQVLVTVDTFEGVADDELGHWMTRIALRLPNTMLVLARTPSDYILHKTSDRFQKYHLENFSINEVQEYLGMRFPGKLQPGIPDVVHRFTDGHPGGVKLAADLIREEGPAELDARRLRRLFEHLPDEPNERWGELVHLILRAADDPRLREAVDAASLTTSFDGPLLAELLSNDGSPEKQVGDLISKLRSYRLVQPVPSISGEPERLRLQEFIRISVARRLRVLDKGRWHQYHLIAAQYWFDQLQHWEDGAYDSYGSWYRYEDSGWQQSKREWLRHSAQFTEKREVTRARFTLVFLDAFWWWGLYLPFPFNRRLLEDWERTASTSRVIGEQRAVPFEQHESPDELLLDALTFLIDNYPTGYMKPTDAPWNELRNKLLLVRDLCDLKRPNRHDLSEEERLDMARADALIELFLAHTRRYRNPGDPRADQYYTEALNAFERLGDDWNFAWTLLERADLAVQRDNPAEAANLVSRSAQRARDLAARTDEEWDHELLANLHRIRADAHELCGEIDEAAVAYGRAICHAYLFHGEPHAPDEYTQQFYIEITTRAAQLIEKLADSATRQQFISTLRRVLPEEWVADNPVPTPLQYHDAAALSEQLFPSGPAENELRTKGSAFMNEWRLLRQDIQSPVGLTDLIMSD